MTDSTECLQQRVKDVLTDEPLTAQEIAEKAGGTISMIRLALGTLEHNGQAISMGARPIRYCRPKMPQKIERGEYTGEPRPYLRPGSYTPPARPKITLAGTDIENLLEID